MVYPKLLCKTGLLHTDGQIGIAAKKAATKAATREGESSCRLILMALLEANSASSVAFSVR